MDQWLANLVAWHQCGTMFFATKQSFNPPTVPVRLAKSQMDPRVVASWDQWPWRYIQLVVNNQFIVQRPFCTMQHMLLLAKFLLPLCWPYMVLIPAGTATQTWKRLAKRKTTYSTTLLLEEKTKGHQLISNACACSSNIIPYDNRNLLYMYIYIYYKYTHIHIDLLWFRYIPSNLHRLTHIYIYMCICIYIYIYACTYIYIYIQTVIGPICFPPCVSKIWFAIDWP